MAPSPKPWFRFYTEATYDRKLRRLKPEYRWLFVACLCAARQSPVPGFLMVGDTAMGLDDLADLAAMHARAVQSGMDALLVAGLVQVDAATGAWLIPSWQKRQWESDLSTERVRTSRKRRSNGDVTADVTAPETEAETESPQPPARRGAKDCVLCQGRGTIYSATAGRDMACRCATELPDLKVVGGSS